MAGARPIPLADVPSRIDEVQGSGEILVICHLGGRSMKAAEFLTANGVTAVNVAGGTQAWIESGRPVESGDGG